MIPRDSYSIGSYGSDDGCGGGGHGYGGGGHGDYGSDGDGCGGSGGGYGDDGHGGGHRYVGGRRFDLIHAAEAAEVIHADVS